MIKKILQIENTNNEDFKNEILGGVKELLLNFKKDSTEDDKLLTREETAQMLSISLVTLWKYSKNNVLPAFRIGTKVRYKKSEVLSALKKMNQFD
ncbi:helix-turn-helix domain-containing protein [uncultured Lacinutrix sp.]|uniref:helix-turn-helix domain-containing protein n=1 Tax=uncultured Lacinutrix sp. TaxID=574032 RepID=UPI00260948F3|nr:helix-turn-helix domain-containing protein [uncultured Lacinutrix sp.]